MREPDYEGVGGRAWRLNIKPTTKAHEATLAVWLIEGPHHPIWRWHTIHAVHLRDIPGVRPASKHYSDAEYEIGINSVDPEFEVDVDSIEAGVSTLKFLRPTDLVHQFHGVTDVEAANITLDMTTTILIGKASPDVDFSSFWGRFIDDRAFLLSGVVDSQMKGEVPE